MYSSVAGRPESAAPDHTALHSPSRPLSLCKFPVPPRGCRRGGMRTCVPAKQPGSREPASQPASQSVRQTCRQTDRQTDRQTGGAPLGSPERTTTCTSVRAQRQQPSHVRERIEARSGACVVCACHPVNPPEHRKIPDSAFVVNTLAAGRTCSGAHQRMMTSAQGSNRKWSPRFTSPCF